MKCSHAATLRGFMNRSRKFTTFLAASALTGALAAAAQAAPAPPVELIERPAATFERSLERAERQAERARQAARERKQRRAEAEFAPQDGAVAGVSLATLESIAACESGGDPTAVNPAGYYGKYQFDMGTWASVGGSGNPAKASEAEQDYRAGVLYSRAGASPWPVCG